jgi:DNA-binding beta-propeller fold protein YncE
MKKNIFLIITLFMLFVISGNTQIVKYLSVPGYNELSKIDTNSYSVLPSGRYVQPAGQSLRITHDPFGLAISSDQKVAITMHENAITIIDLQNMQQKRIPDYLKPKENPLKKGSFLGVAFHTNKNIAFSTNNFIYKGLDDSDIDDLLS